MSANFSLFLNFFFLHLSTTIPACGERERERSKKGDTKTTISTKKKQICLRSRVLLRVVLLLARTNTRASVVEAQEESQCNECNTLHLHRVKARRR